MESPPSRSGLKVTSQFREYLVSPPPSKTSLLTSRCDHYTKTESIWKWTEKGTLTPVFVSLTLVQNNAFIA